MSEEMKLRKEKLFSQAKNGYDRISAEDLAALDFTKVLYNWDCC